MTAIVVIPTYNEATNITPLIKIILGFNLNIGILIVDDNSPDGTGKIADGLSKEYPQVSVIHRPKKQGLGRAYIEGFHWAIKQKPDYIIEMDADFSHNPEKIPEFLKQIENYDLVIGSRYLNGMVSVINWPIKRLIISLVANNYTRLITGLKIHDCTGGFKCFRREVLENINLDRITSDGYAFQIEMNFRAQELGYHIGEIPIIFADRHSGTSKMSRKIMWEALFLVWKLRIGSFFKIA
ncbi:MAG: polyprenol monophosphomannose synthase [bacterium]|nr:polyprenol monophosphomannose synthase [bacterium]